MSSTTFVDNNTIIYASWLNDVNTATYTTIPSIQGSLTGINNILTTTTVRQTSSTGTAGIPSGTTAQRDTALGVGIRYNTNNLSFEGYNGSAWGSIGGGATGGGPDTIFQVNSVVMTTNYTIPTGKNASLVGPLTINSGVSLTIPSGQRVVIL